MSSFGQLNNDILLQTEICDFQRCLNRPTHQATQLVRWLVPRPLRSILCHFITHDQPGTGKLHHTDTAFNN